MQLEDLVPGVRVSGVLPGDVSIIAVHPYGDSAVEVTYKDGDGEVGQQILYRADEAKLKLAAASGPPFDGDGAVFRLVAEALRIKMAGQHDTMLAVTTSDLEPLPHQIKAVYGELLPRVPLRFLLADVWTSTDLVGVEVCAALKNCYALGVGFAEGVLDRLGQADSPDRNHNYEAALFAQAVAEIGQMVRLLGGRPETPYGLAGVGDMFVTSTGGRNIRVGRLLGGGLRFSEARARMGDITLEGAAAIQVIGGALPKLAARGIIGSEDFPLLRRLHAVVGREQPPQIPWSAFFGGEVGAVAAARELAG